MEKDRKFLSWERRQYEKTKSGGLLQQVQSGELLKRAENAKGCTITTDSGKEIYFSPEAEANIYKTVAALAEAMAADAERDLEELPNQHRQAGATAGNWAAVHAYELYLMGFSDKQIEAVEVGLYKTGSRHTEPLNPERLQYRYKGYDSNRQKDIAITGNEPRKRIARVIKAYNETEPQRIRAGGAMTTNRLKQYPFLYNLLLIYEAMGEDAPQIAAAAQRELAELDSFLESIADQKAADFITRHYIHGESWEQIADSMEEYYSRAIYDEETGEEWGMKTPFRDAPRKYVERYLARWNEAAGLQEKGQAAEG